MLVGQIITEIQVLHTEPRAVLRELRWFLTATMVLRHDSSIAQKLTGRKGNRDYRDYSKTLVGNPATLAVITLAIAEFMCA